jgi:hypothetical protein
VKRISGDGFVSREIILKWVLICIVVESVGSIFQHQDSNIIIGYLCDTGSNFVRHHNI